MIEAMQKIDKMMEQKVNKKGRNTEIKKDNIDEVRKNVNKELKELDEGPLICEKLFKDLKRDTPVTPAKSLLKVHKNPLKIRLVISTQNSTVCKIDVI